MAGPKQNPFQLPPEPKTDWDLIRWTLFEWPRLLDWSRHLSRKHILVLYLVAMAWILLLAIGVYGSSLAVVVALELPLDFPAQFKPTVVQICADNPGFGERLIGLLSVTGMEFETKLAFGLAAGLAVGLAVGLAMGLAGGLARGLAGGLALGLAWGLAEGLVGGMEVGLGAGIGVFLGWVVGFLHLPFYLPQAVVALIRLDLYHNPYRWDAGVRLPIWGARRRLTGAAFDDPETGTRFAEFLLEYRPLQRKLAAAVLHAAHAGRWRLRPLNPELLTPPPVPEDRPGYAPSAGWLRELAGLRQDLAAARGQTQISFKRAAYARFSQRLNAFRDLTLRESPRWNRWYPDALDSWRSEAAKELHRIEDQAASQEPIAVNRYRTGTPLRPEDD